MRRTTTWALLCGVAVASLGSETWAERRPSAPSRSGFEASLHGNAAAIVDRPYRLRGVAYEVLGLATLRALPGARLRARYRSAAADVADGPWHSTEADGAGRFSFDLPVPPQARGRSHMLVEVGDGRQSRMLELPVELTSPLVADMRADRRLYQPGEPVHIWVRARDGGSLAPASGEVVELSGPHAEVPERSAVTSASGVASFAFDLPETAEEGRRVVEARVGSGAAQVRQRIEVRVGLRHTERLAVEVEASPEIAPPGGAVAVTVTVRTPSGAPVRGASVELRLGDGSPQTTSTDATGAAVVQGRAPTFLPDETATVPITGAAAHPAHGAIAIRGSLRLAMPLAIAAEAVAAHGGLVPEVDGQLIVSLLDAAEDPPEAGTEVVVRGPAVRGGRHRAVTDRHGLVVVPTRLPRSAAAERLTDRWPRETSTTVHVEVGGPTPRAVELSVPVLPDALVSIVPDEVLVEAGGRVRARVERRPAVRRREVMVDLLARRGDRPEVLRSAVVPVGRAAVDMEVPAERAGVLWLRARPLGLPGIEEGQGAMAAILARPAEPTFPTSAPERPVYQVRETARVTVTTPVGAPRSWIAVLARDLAMHGGEDQFELGFLGEAFDRAVLDPEQEGAALLVRAALSAHARPDQAAPVAPPLVDDLGRATTGGFTDVDGRRRGDLRNPVAAGEELRRRGTASVMMALEQALAEAVDRGDVAHLTVGSGRDRVFREDAVERAFEGDRRQIPEALAGTPITVAMLVDGELGFDFDAVARRVARARLVTLLASLAANLDPEGEGGRSPLLLRTQPDQWLSRLVELGGLRATDLDDPWGGTFALRRAPSTPVLSLSPDAPLLELASPGPDGRSGTADDVRDPFARAVPAATPYAVASGEDELMAELASTAVGQRVLEMVLAAYGRAGSAAREERIGDAAVAGASELSWGGLGLHGVGRGGGGTGEGTIGLGNLATIGHGGGGGSGSGYGRGAGGLRGRRASAGGGRGLGALIRQRFPATLRFLPDTEVHPSGRTVVELPLADAVTTYAVETVLWREDGWTWSTSTEVRVDQEVVVDAPVPPFATKGDRLRLPLRVANRTKGALHARLGATTDEAIGAAPVEAPPLTVPAGDATEATVELALDSVADGVVTVTAAASDGSPLDGSSRPLSVLPDGRRARDAEEAIVSGSGGVTLHVPEGATPLDGSEVQIVAGDALLEAELDQSPLHHAWSDSFAGRPVDDGIAAGLVDILPDRMDATAGGNVARAVAALWAHPAAPDERVEIALVALARRLGSPGMSQGADRHVVTRDAVALLHLAPALRAAPRRPTLAPELRALAADIRRRLESRAPRLADAPWTWAVSAAALAWSSSSSTDPRADELARRAERFLVEVGDDLWLEGGPGDRGDHATSYSAVLALADLRLGRRQRAFRLVRTVARMTDGGGSRRVPARALARVVALLLAEGDSPEAVLLSIDGVERRVPLVDGVATVSASELGSSGEHEVGVRASEGAVVLLRARAAYGLPWSVEPSAPGPFVLSLEGEVGARDETAELTLVVRNRAPRLVASPTIEVYLPAGSELDRGARLELEEATGSEPALSGRVLTLRLRALPPGGAVEVDLPIRWSVSGALRGLGVAAYAADRPRAASVLPSRLVEVE